MHIFLIFLLIAAVILFFLVVEIYQPVCSWCSRFYFGATGGDLVDTF